MLVFVDWRMLEGADAAHLVTKGAHHLHTVCGWRLPLQAGVTGGLNF